MRLFELRIAESPSFYDGIFSRRSFPEGYLLNSLLTASDREDLLTLLVQGIGTDSLVIPDNDRRMEVQSVIADLIEVCALATSCSLDNVTHLRMQKSNYRFVPVGLVNGAHVLLPLFFSLSDAADFAWLISASLSSMKVRNLSSTNGMSGNI